MDVVFLSRFFVFAFFLNLVWELLHSQLYITCYKLPLRKYVRLMFVMSLKDAFFILVFYSVSVFIFNTIVLQLSFFALISLGFSFIDEKISLRKKRWQYGKAMPLFFGVGVTPLLEVAVTGLLVWWLIT